VSGGVNCCLVPSYSQAILMDDRSFGGDRKTAGRHHYCDVGRRGRHYASGARLRRVQSSASFQRLRRLRPRATGDVKPSTSLTSHLHGSAPHAAILMTSRPPSYDTAMCVAAGAAALSDSSAHRIDNRPSGNAAAAAAGACVLFVPPPTAPSYVG